MSSLFVRYAKKTDNIYKTAFNQFWQYKTGNSHFLIKEFQNHIGFYGTHKSNIDNIPLQYNNVIAVYNDEIYNWQELIKKHSTLGFDNNSVLYLNDTSIRSVEFSLILHNLDTNVIYAARDHLGIRPLFYYWNKGELQIASDKNMIDSPQYIIPGNIYSFELNTNNVDIMMIPKLNQIMQMQMFFLLAPLRQ